MAELLPLDDQFAAFVHLLPVARAFELLLYFKDERRRVHPVQNDAWVLNRPGDDRTRRARVRLSLLVCHAYPNPNRSSIALRFSFFAECIFSISERRPSMSFSSLSILRSALSFCVCSRIVFVLPAKIAFRDSLNAPIPCWMRFPLS